MIALVCLHCDHSNLADANFCSACGAGLLRRLCPACHVANGVGAQFCHACGFRLQQQADDERALATTGPQLSLVRSRAVSEAEAAEGGEGAVALGAPPVEGDAAPAAADPAPSRWWAGSSARGVAGFVVIAALFAWLVDASTAPYARSKTSAAQDPLGALPSPSAAPATAPAAAPAAGPAFAPEPAPATATAPPAGAMAAAPSALAGNPPAPAAPAADPAAAALPAPAAPVAAATAAPTDTAVPAVADTPAPPVVASAQPAAAPALARPAANSGRRERAAARQAQAGVRAAAPAAPLAPVRRPPAVACTANALALGLCNLNP